MLDDRKVRRHLALVSFLLSAVAAAAVVGAATGVSLAIASWQSRSGDPLTDLFAEALALPAVAVTGVVLVRARSGLSGRGLDAIGFALAAGASLIYLLIEPAKWGLDAGPAAPQQACRNALVNVGSQTFLYGLRLAATMLAVVAVLELVAQLRPASVPTRAFNPAWFAVPLVAGLVVGVISLYSTVLVFDCTMG